MGGYSEDHMKTELGPVWKHSGARLKPQLDQGNVPEILTGGPPGDATAATVPESLLAPPRLPRDIT